MKVEDESSKANQSGLIQKWVPRDKILFIIGKIRRDLDTPITWVNVTCNDFEAAVSRKYIFDEVADTESELDERNSEESNLEEDDYIPYPYQEDTEDTSWWDDDFNHNW
jgi:hypothetical protein